MELTKEQLKQLLPKNPHLDYWYNALEQFEVFMLFCKKT